MVLGNSRFYLLKGGCNGLGFRAFRTRKVPYQVTGLDVGVYMSISIQ